jgi:hypothetical protein
MPAWLFVVGGILALVGALLAVDWVTAGHTKRKLVRAKDQSSTDANVGYAAIQRQGQSMENQGNTFI